MPGLPLITQPQGTDPVAMRSVRDKVYRVWFFIMYGCNDHDYVRRQGNRFAIQLTALRTRFKMSSAEMRRVIRAMESSGIIYNVVINVTGNTSYARFAMVLPPYLQIVEGDPSSKPVSMLKGGPRWQYPEY